MFLRYLTPGAGRMFVICATASTLASWHITPAFASSTAPATGKAPKSVSREIPTDQLHPTTVLQELDATRLAPDRANEEDETLSSARYLAPEAEALRQVLEDDLEAAAEPPSDDDSAEDGEKRPAIKASVPGVSEGDLARYKRHMFRRDI